MEERGEDRDEALADLREVLERDRAFIELAVLHPRVENPGHHAADAAGRGLGERAGRGFHRVRQHQHRRLLRGRLGARIAEIALLHPRVRLLRLVEEEGHEGGAVVLQDSVQDGLG